MNKKLTVVKNNNRLNHNCEFAWIICKNDVKKHENIECDSAFFT